jgi:nitrogen fixation protein NifZ
MKAQTELGLGQDERPEGVGLPSRPAPLAPVRSAAGLREPKYQWGQRVRAGVDLYNDGSHPEHEPEALLVPAGAGGEIVQTGMHVETRTPVYMVEFDGVPHVVGCLEEEIAPE